MFWANRRQPESYSEMGSEKFSNSAKSGYNKGTIRSDIRYLVVSKDVRRHRLISIDYITTLPVTAEVAHQKSCSDFTGTIEDPKGHVFVPFFVSLLAVLLSQCGLRCNVSR
jgi:hypothetical protein